ncbi:MAG: hypothetical protein ACYC2O_03935 [Microthrixaceae bacterium]
MSEVTTATSSTGSDAGTTMQEHAAGLADSVREQGGEVARSAVDHARTVIDEAGDQMRRQGDEQAIRLAGSLSSVSTDLRSMADSAGRGSIVGDVTRSLAESTDRVATVLREEGPNGGIRRASQFGREHPVQFLALAAGAGFVVARLVRNSDARHLQDVAKEAASDSGATGGDGTGDGTGTGTGTGTGMSGGTTTNPGDVAGSGESAMGGTVVLPASAVGP